MLLFHLESKQNGSKCRKWVAVSFLIMGPRIWTIAISLDVETYHQHAYKEEQNERKAEQVLILGMIRVEENKRGIEVSQMQLTNNTQPRSNSVLYNSWSNSLIYTSCSYTFQSLSKACPPTTHRHNVNLAIELILLVMFCLFHSLTFQQIFLLLTKAAHELALPDGCRR